MIPLVSWKESHKSHQIISVHYANHLSFPNTKVMNCTTDSSLLLAEYFHPQKFTPQNCDTYENFSSGSLLCPKIKSITSNVWMKWEWTKQVSNTTSNNLMMKTWVLFMFTPRRATQSQFLTTENQMWSLATQITGLHLLDDNSTICLTLLLEVQAMETSTWIIMLI